MQHLYVSGAVRPLKWPLGVKWLTSPVRSCLVVKLNYEGGTGSPYILASTSILTGFPLP